MSKVAAWIIITINYLNRFLVFDQQITYILYASVLMQSRTWLIPSKYCSAIGCTHSFSSIFRTDLLPNRSRFAVKRNENKISVNDKNLISQEKNSNQFLEVAQSNDCFECEALSIERVLQSHEEYQGDRYLGGQAGNF